MSAVTLGGNGPPFVAWLLSNADIGASGQRSGGGASGGQPGSGWTPEEDSHLISLIAKHGEVDWPIRAKELGTGRSPKACQTLPTSTSVSAKNSTVPQALS